VTELPSGRPDGLPSGTVTFLFTDVEGSTRLMRRLGDRWPEVHAGHRRLLREAFARSGGREIDTQGDAFFVAFARARDGVNAAAAAQEALRSQEWPEGVELRVRMGLHTGEPAVGEEGYLGMDVVRAARLCAAAHGGQVLLSETTRALLRGDEPAGVELRDLGEHSLKDVDHPERIFQLVAPGLDEGFPPLRSLDAPEPRTPNLPMPLEGRRGELSDRVQAAAEELRASILTQVEQGLREGARRRPAAAPPPPHVAPLVLAGVTVALFFATIVVVVYLLAS
jgi:class 3 adenylate cyclase